MRDWLSLAAERAPEHPALIFVGKHFSYRELDAQVTRAAGWLSSLGVTAGTRVGVYARPSFETVVVIFAVARVGGFLIPLNLRLTFEELAYQVVFADVVLFEGDSVQFDQKSVSVNDYAKFSGDGIANREIELDDTFALMFTSGTSGKPKAAELTYGNLYYSALASEMLNGASADDRWLCCLPLYHIGALAMLTRALIYGMTVILHDGFELTRVNKALDEDAVTHISLVPTMLFRLIPARTAPPPHLKLCLVGGAAATPELVELAQAAGFPVATTYGLTEAASQVATQSIAQTRLKPSSVGRSAAGITDLWIEDERGERLPAGEIGEVVVTGKTVMRGYFGDAAATALTLRDGALHTGDLGYLDADGDLWLVQRRSDLIVTGGENVYPAEVEAALRTHPHVKDACVVGIPHPEWGQQVAALVVADGSITREQLIGYLRAKIAGYKLPRVIRFIDELPMTGNGKVARKLVVTQMIDYANLHG